MKRLLVLGGGTAGTMAANKLRRRLNRNEWEIILIDSDDAHLYQPGLLFVPFGAQEAADLVKSRQRFLAAGVELRLREVDRVDPDTCEAIFTDGTWMVYDYLVIATGTSPRPERVPGMLGELWRERVFDFYTLDGAKALAEALSGFDHGRLVVNLADLTIKWPVGPLEFALLAESHFRQRGIRDQVEIVYVTPGSGAIDVPACRGELDLLLNERKIALEAGFAIERIDNEAATLVARDGRQVPFDLLVTAPPNAGADYISRSEIGDELNYVPADPRTLLSEKIENIFVIGDASSIPAWKVGSVAHFAVDVLAENFPEYVAGRPMAVSYDGHTDCFIETGDGRGLLLDFSYETEPLAGSYPVPGLGPFSLLRETPVNHWGKLASRWLYWHALLPGRPVPLPDRMPMAGKHQPRTGARIRY